jgi:hypothetical protein
VILRDERQLKSAGGYVVKSYVKGYYGPGSGRRLLPERVLCLVWATRFVTLGVKAGWKHGFTLRLATTMVYL